MEIKKYRLGQLQTNCYLLIRDNNCLIIDPADEANFILEVLQGKKLKLIGMLATHGHFDHIGAAGEIQLSNNVPLFIFKQDQFLVDRLNQTAQYFLGHNPYYIQPKKVSYLHEGRFRISPVQQAQNGLSESRKMDFEFRILSCPGHTPGGCCFYFPDEKALFSGDSLFKQGVGRYDFSYCNKRDLKKSIEKLMQLPGETTVYPGHGEITKIKDEKNAPCLII